MSTKFSRRSFLLQSTAASALPVIPAAQANAKARLSWPPSKNFGFFTEDERDIVARLSDQVFPGATRLGIVGYVEGLLTAFEVDPPRIFAGGPISDQGNPFVPLTRSQEAAWRLRLYGSGYFKGGWWNHGVLGEYKGLRDIFKKGLAEINVDDDGTPQDDSVPSDLRLALRDLVLEGCFASPDYGGNADKKGWELTHFPGGNQPNGYTADEVSKPDATDPDKMGFLTRIFLYFVTIFQGGRSF